MRISKLNLINFRNYSKLNISFEKNMNIIVGDNAQGKTNLLESIYVLALTNTFLIYSSNIFLACLSLSKSL